MSESEDDFLQEVKDEVPIPPEEKLRTLASLAEDQLEIDEQIADFEMQIARLKEERKKIAEGLIPELMQQIGVKEFKLTDGKKVTVAPFFSGKITDEKAYEWLKDHGHADIAKTRFEVPLAMDNEFVANKIREFLYKNEIEWTEKTGVHHSTLNAWIKEQITEGKEIDRELFHVFTGFRASIK